MAFAPIPLPSAWDVPVAAGVSAVLGQSIGAGISATASTALGGIIENAAFGQPKTPTPQKGPVNQAPIRWGIFDNKNRQFATTAHVMGVDYENGYSVPNAPLTDGSFAAYNKVKHPYSARVILVCDGTESGVDAAAKETVAL